MKSAGTQLYFLLKVLGHLRAAMPGNSTSLYKEEERISGCEKWHRHLWWAILATEQTRSLTDSEEDTVGA